MERTVRSVASAAKLLVACTAVVGPAAGAQITWTNWTNYTVGTPGTATGDMGGVTVTYTGEVASGSQTSAGGTQYFNPNNSDGGQTFTNSTYGADGPGTNPGYIRLIGGNQITNTLTFSTPVNDLFFSIISMGQQTDPVSYTFNNAFTITSQGSGWWGTCTSAPCLTEAGTVLTGTEGDGTLMFSGPITSISWTAAPAEDWHGFTVGTSTVPEPSSIALLGTGLLGIVPMVRKRRK